jgi:YD repeat-containing protein
MNSTLYQRRDNRGTTTADDRVETFSYDALDRLISAQTSHESGRRILSFGYDAAGNLTG